MIVIVNAKIDILRTRSESEHESSGEEKYLSDLDDAPNVNEYNESRSEIKSTAVKILKNEIIGLLNKRMQARKSKEKKSDQPSSTSGSVTITTTKSSLK